MFERAIEDNQIRCLLFLTNKLKKMSKEAVKQELETLPDILD